MIKSFCIGPLATNCYLYTDDETGISAVIDPAYPSQQLIDCAKASNVKYILLTHGHIDHIAGIKAIKEATGAKVIALPLERERLNSADLNLYTAFSMYYNIGFASADIDIEADDGEVFNVGNSAFTVMHTPGHTEGSVCYICKDIIFSGDTLFCSSYGRVDFPGGSMSKMIDSFCRLCEIDGDYKGLPGHNEFTDLEYERQNNPLSHYYLQGMY